MLSSFSRVLNVVDIFNNNCQSDISIPTISFQMSLFPWKQMTLEIVLCELTTKQTKYFLVDFLPFKNEKRMMC